VLSTWQIQLLNKLIQTARLTLCLFILLLQAPVHLWVDARKRSPAQSLLILA
jgi:hypothetical protein